MTEVLLQYREHANPLAERCLALYGEVAGGGKR